MKKEKKDKKDQPLVAIVILNWNGKNDTLECLQSLQKLSYSNYEVIVVDNGSIDGSPEVILQHFPEITLLRNKENLGFTGGNNVGIQHALKKKAEYVVLLNNDTTVEHNLVAAMLECFNTNQRIGLVGPKVVYYSEPESVWCAGGSYNAVLGKGRMYGHDTYPKKRFDDERQVGWISFCVVMIKAKVFTKIGLLDDQYFSSNEDLDFCINAKKVGFMCYYTPQTIVKHKIARDWGGLDNPLYIYYQVRNSLLFYKKNRTFPGFLISFFYYLFISLPRRAITFYNKDLLKRTKYFYYGIADFCRQRLGKGYYAQKIINELQTSRDKRLKVGINVRYLQRKETGIEKYIKELIIHLAQNDKNVCYSLFHNKGDPFKSPVQQQNVRLVPFGPKKAGTILRILWEQCLLWKTLQKEHVEVFHGPSFLVPIIKPKQCKYVVSVMDLSYLTQPESYTLKNKFYFQVFLRRSLAVADKIIAISEATKKDIIKYFSITAEKIAVIPLGVGKEYYPRDAHTAAEKNAAKDFKKKYDLHDPYILFVGSLIPRKNLLRVIQAFELLKQKNYPHKFVVVGKKGWLYEGTFAYVREHHLQKEVLFMDYATAEDLPFFYSFADVFVYPSLYEGFGLPILEAMACGCPVITSTVSSMPEVAGDAALFVDPYDVQALQTSMAEIIVNKELRKSIIQKGFQRCKQFSWEKTAAETIALYHSFYRSSDQKQNQ